METKHFNIILDKMSSYVGKKWNDIDDSDNTWYQKHSWTKEQQDEFLKWLISYLKNSSEARN